MTGSIQPFQPLQGLNVAEIGARPEVSVCGGILAALGARVYADPQPNAAVSADKTAFGSRRDACVASADIILASSDTGLLPVPAEHQILCDITAYGRSGPLVGRPDSEALVQARAGIAATTGVPDGAPLLTGAPFIGMETAVYAASGILTALLHRDMCGRGQQVEVALYDVAVNALLTFLPLVFTGREATRAGNRHPTLAPWNAYPASDGWILICGPTDDQWRRLTRAVGQPALAKDARFSSPTLRFENREQLDKLIATWTRARDVATCARIVGEAGIPCGPILRLDELLSERNLQHRQSCVVLEGQIVPRLPLRVEGMAPPPVDGPVIAETPISAGRPKPLSGVRVLEIGMNTVAPLACRQLGALGADVIKVEPPRGDSNRTNAPLRTDGQAYVFALSNTDKRGVVLDLADAEDAARLWRMIATADVVFENLKPGSLDRLGFGATQVREKHPELVYVSVNGFGKDSVYPGRPALDTVIQAMSGAMDSTICDGMPMKAGISVSDQMGGQFGLLAVLAGLFARTRSGTGVTYDIAMQDCSVWASLGGRPAGKTQILACLDGWIISEGDLAQWDSTISRVSAMKELEARGISAGAVLSVEEVVSSDQTRARGLLREVPTPDGSGWTVLNCPIRLSRDHSDVRLAMPRLGWKDATLTTEFGWHEESV